MKKLVTLCAELSFRSTDFLCIPAARSAVRAAVKPSCCTEGTRHYYFFSAANKHKDNAKVALDFIINPFS